MIRRAKQMQKLLPRDRKWRNGRRNWPLASRTRPLSAQECKKWIVHRTASEIRAAGVSGTGATALYIQNEEGDNICPSYHPFLKAGFACHRLAAFHHQQSQACHRAVQGRHRRLHAFAQRPSSRAAWRTGWPRSPRLWQPGTRLIPIVLRHHSPSTRSCTRAMTVLSTTCRSVPSTKCPSSSPAWVHVRM